MERRNISPRFYDRLPYTPQTYPIDTVGEVTFYRQEFRAAVADTALSALSERGEARLPLFSYQGENDDGDYDTEETILDIWWGSVDANLESSGANPLENVMALFEEEGNAVMEDVKEELRRYVPQILEQHGVPVDAEVGWEGVTYTEPGDAPSYRDGERDVTVEAGTRPMDLEETSTVLPERTTLRGEDSWRAVADVPISYPLDEEETAQQLGKRDSEAWDES